MGWLECEPESLFHRDRFVVGDVQWIIPHQLRFLVRRAAPLLPQWLRESVIQPVLATTFTARPMQVMILVHQLTLCCFFV